MTIHELIADRSHSASDAIAILSPGRTPLSYARLYRLMEETVANMGALGIGRNDRVAVVLPNGPEMATAFLSISAGAIAAPLNPAYGKSEFEFFLTDLCARALVVQTGMDSAAVDAAKAHGIPVYRLSCVPEAEAGVFTLSDNESIPDANPGFSMPEDVALVLHTSGTTSRPKIVPLTQANLTASARNISRALALTNRDRCLNVMPLFHIHGLVGAVLSSLAAGASVVCTPGFYATKFFEWIEQCRPTWYTAVPTMHQAILTRAEANREIIARHPLRLIRSCSAALPPKIMAALESAFDAPVIESYGMTEASHQMASNPLPPARRKPGSVGIASGPDIAIMDEFGTLLPSRETGEIVIRGKNVTRGYEGNPPANEAAFIAGWFRTGDQGYFDDEGYLYITARIKEIINRGGEKISPREVDEVLLEHPDIVQAVAFPIPHTQLGEEIGVSVILRDGASLTEAQIREFVSNRLVNFKVPRVVKIVEEIPKGPTGKLQRIGLAEKLGIGPIDDTQTPEKDRSIEGRTALDNQLIETWKEVLALKDIGIHDNFFSLGGDSILATQLMAQVSRKMGVNVPFVSFLETPTVAGMAEQVRDLDHKRSGAGWSQLVAIQPNGNKPPLFCASGHTGSLLGYSYLARHLEADRPLLGFPPLSAGRESAFLKVEDIAAHYISLMREVQPDGPYFLIGVCFGGFVVYELARQLGEQNQRVALLAMLDSCNRSWVQTLPWTTMLSHRYRHFVRRSRFHLNYVAQLDPKEGVQYVAHRTRVVFQNIWEQFGSRAYALSARTGNLLPRFFQQERYSNRYAHKQYEPKPYTGSALLFRSPMPRAGTYPAPLMGWQGLITGEVELYDLPFHPLGVLAEPVAPVIAQHLNPILAKVQIGSALTS